MTSSASPVRQWSKVALAVNLGVLVAHAIIGAQVWWCFTHDPGRMASCSTRTFYVGTPLVIGSVLAVLYGLVWLIRHRASLGLVPAVVGALSSLLWGLVFLADLGLAAIWAPSLSGHDVLLGKGSVSLNIEPSDGAAVSWASDELELARTSSRTKMLTAVGTGSDSSELMIGLKGEACEPGRRQIVFGGPSDSEAVVRVRVRTSTGAYRRHGGTHGTYECARDGSDLVFRLRGVTLTDLARTSTTGTLEAEGHVEIK